MPNQYSNDISGGDVTGTSPFVQLVKKMLQPGGLAGPNQQKAYGDTGINNGSLDFSRYGPALARPGAAVGDMEFGGGLGALRSGAGMNPLILDWLQQNDPYMEEVLQGETVSGQMERVANRARAQLSQLPYMPPALPTPVPTPAPTPSPQETPESFRQMLAMLMNQG